jgi:hypothetical protein
VFVPFTYFEQLESALQHVPIAPAGSHCLPAATYVLRQVVQPFEQPLLGSQPRVTQ